MENNDEKNLYAIRAMKAEVMDRSNNPGDRQSNNNIDKIREILVGENIRDHENKLNTLEERLRRETNSLKEDTKKRIDGLENYVKSELTFLNEQLRTEIETKEDALRELIDSEIKNTTRNFDKRLKQLEVQINTSNRENRETLLEQTQGLSDEIRNKFEELWTILQRETKELNFMKTDRNSLANLFNEIASRLKNEAKLQDNDLF
jgi:hypothetical protein